MKNTSKKLQKVYFAYDFEGLSYTHPSERGTFLEKEVESLLQEMIEAGKLTYGEASDLVESMRKETYVLERHKTNKGAQRAIAEKKPGLWYTRLPGEKFLYGASYKELIEKLYTYYVSLENPTDLTFEEAFYKALEAKKAEKNVKAGTITKNRNDFIRLFNCPEGKAFIKRSVSEIDDAAVMTYINAFAKDFKPLETALSAYFGIFRLTLIYAFGKGLLKKYPLADVNAADYFSLCSKSDKSEEVKILSPEEIASIQKYLREVMEKKMYKGYCYNAYPVLIAIETGMRSGELCSLKWKDVHFEKKNIHIHTQQIFHYENHRKVYEYCTHTKNEKKGSRGGRFFPITDKIYAILMELKEVQEKVGIESEFVFCNFKGEWLTTSGYESFLRGVCENCGLEVTNNHAFRMSLNTNVFIPLGIEVGERAKLLGHSIETNLKHYTFAKKEYLETARNLLNNAG